MNTEQAIQKLELVEKELQECKAFIARARQESQLVQWQDQVKVLVPYWFMRDDKND